MSAVAYGIFRVWVEDWPSSDVVGANAASDLDEDGCLVLKTYFGLAPGGTKCHAVACHTGIALHKSRGSCAEMSADELSLNMLNRAVWVG